MSLKKKKNLVGHDNILADAKEEDLGNRVKEMLRSRFIRRNLLKTGLIGAGLYTLEKSILNPVEARANASDPNWIEPIWPRGLLPTRRSIRSNLTLLNSEAIATEIEQIRKNSSKYQSGTLEVWQALAKLIEVNQQFVDEYRKQQNNPDYSISGIPVRELTDFFNRAGIGQNPIGVILGCVDSRVHYERRLSLKDSDDIPAFFVERSIGNIVNPYSDSSLGATLQYNLEGIGRKVVLMIQMVHQNCGMVGATASGKAFKLGGSLKKAGSLVKPAVEPGSTWKEFIGYWPNQTDADVNVMANGIMQLGHLFASDKYLRQKLKEKRILPILGYVPLNTPQIYLFRLPSDLLTTYEKVTIKKR